MPLIMKTTMLMTLLSVTILGFFTQMTNGVHFDVVDNDSDDDYIGEEGEFVPLFSVSMMMTTPMVMMMVMVVMMMMMMATPMRALMMSMTMMFMLMATTAVMVIDVVMMSMMILPYSDRDDYVDVDGGEQFLTSDSLRIFFYM